VLLLNGWFSSATIKSTEMHPVLKRSDGSKPPKPFTIDSSYPTTLPALLKIMQAVSYASNVV